jgi:hypothetical protein
MRRWSGTPPTLLEIVAGSANLRTFAFLVDVCGFVVTPEVVHQAICYLNHDMWMDAWNHLPLGDRDGHLASFCATAAQVGDERCLHWLLDHDEDGTPPWAQAMSTELRGWFTTPRGDQILNTAAAVVLDKGGTLAALMKEGLVLSRIRDPALHLALPDDLAALVPIANAATWAAVAAARARAEDAPASPLQCEPVPLAARGFVECARLRNDAEAKTREQIARNIRDGAVPDRVWQALPSLASPSPPNSIRAGALLGSGLLSRAVDEFGSVFLAACRAGSELLTSRNLPTSELAALGTRPLREALLGIIEVDASEQARQGLDAGEAAEDALDESALGRFVDELEAIVRTPTVVAPDGPQPLAHHHRGEGERGRGAAAQGWRVS